MSNTFWRTAYGGAWFFKAPGFQAGQFRLAALKRIFRQEDEAFIRILNGLRNARLSDEDEEVLQTRVSTRSPAEASQTHVVLTPNNAAAWRINQMRLAELPGPRARLHGVARRQFRTEGVSDRGSAGAETGRAGDDDPQRSVGAMGQRIARRGAGAGRERLLM